MKETLVLLDLEETLIDEWDSFTLVNVAPVQRWVAGLKSAADATQVPVRFGLFSFAVWNAGDLARFQKQRDFLESVFGFKFDDNLLWTVEDISKRVEKACRVHFVSKNDFFDFIGANKTLTMVSLVGNDPFFKGKNVVLLDDTVEHDATFTHPSQDSRLTFKNPKNLD
jgi:hypothetical protein